MEIFLIHRVEMQINQLKFMIKILILSEMLLIQLQKPLVFLEALSFKNGNDVIIQVMSIRIL